MRRSMEPSPSYFSLASVIESVHQQVNPGRAQQDATGAHADAAPLTRSDWIDYLQVYGKFRHQEPVEHLVEGLEKAGLLTG